MLLFLPRMKKWCSLASELLLLTGIERCSQMTLGFYRALCRCGFTSGVKCLIVRSRKWKCFIWVHIKSFLIVLVPLLDRPSSVHRGSWTQKCSNPCPTPVWQKQAIRFFCESSNFVPWHKKSSHRGAIFPNALTFLSLLRTSYNLLSCMSHYCRSCLFFADPIDFNQVFDINEVERHDWW